MKEDIRAGGVEVRRGMKVTVIDYGLSNLLSVRHAFATLGPKRC